MTATTPYFGWPYAQPSDARGAGANAMRDLALAEEEAMIPAYFDALVYDGTAQNAGADFGVTVALPGAHTVQGGFTEDGGVVTYTGPTRLFVVTGGLMIDGEQGSPQRVTLTVGGAARAISRRFMPAVDAPGTLDSASHSLTWVGMIPTGVTVSMTAACDSLGAIYFPRLTIASVSPEQL